MVDNHGDYSKIVAISNLLYKLNIAGFERRSITPFLHKIGLEPHINFKYVIRLAVVTTGIEYIVLVPYEKRDKTYDFEA